MKPGMKVMVDDLTLLKSLGKGSYGEVFLTKKEGRNEFFATKKMDRKYADQPNVSKYLKNEIAILRELKHKNIVKLEDVKITKNHYYLVMEYCNGGALSGCLKKYQQKYGTPFSEEIVQYLMRQIIDAMRYIHNRNIIHRDLKLDNILVSFTSETDKEYLNMMKSIVKIIDFGFATHIDKSKLCYSTLGSPINMDPNILKKMTEKKMGINTGQMVGYDQKADIWSLGTLCYEMLIGKSAFNSKTMKELVQKVESGSYVIPTHLSKEVVSFLNAMLQYNSKKRLTSNELARHHFLTKKVNEFESIDLRKVSNKVNQNKLNVNIKRNNTIWSIFNQEDENKLIKIPGNYLVPLAPIKEEEEFHITPENKRRNTEKIPRFPNFNNNNFKNFPHDNNFQNEILKKNTEKYQGYGCGIEGINAYDNSGYVFNNYQVQQNQISPIFINHYQDYQVMAPITYPQIGTVEPEIEEQGKQMYLRGAKPAPIMELPSFGVPSPDEINSGEGGYEFSTGIFENKESEDISYCSHREGINNTKKNE